jgi:hypothetical protein
MKTHYRIAAERIRAAVEKNLRGELTDGKLVSETHRIARGHERHLARKRKKQVTPGMVQSHRWTRR